MSVAGWPATVGGWEIVGGWEEGGVSGWFRSMAIPRRQVVEAWRLAPVGIASL